MIPFNKVTLARHGRGKAIEVELIGEVGQDGKIDTSSLRGTPMVELMQFCGKRDIDPSQALADGINVHLENAVRRTEGNQLAAILISQGLAENPVEARLMAMHVNQLSRKLGTENVAVLNLLASLKKAS